MGSMSRLKLKDELRYRKGSTNESVNCRYCTKFRADYPIYGIGGNGTPLRIESRCEIMGARESVRYRVRADHTCDRHEFDEAKRNW
jgi:hypothetical protein